MRRKSTIISVKSTIIKVSFNQLQVVQIFLYNSIFFLNAPIWIAPHQIMHRRVCVFETMNKKPEWSKWRIERFEQKKSSRSTQIHGDLYRLPCRIGNYRSTFDTIGKIFDFVYFSSVTWNEKEWISWNFNGKKVEYPLEEQFKTKSVESIFCLLLILQWSRNRTPQATH